MRVSNYYKLPHTQPELDFVDVTVHGDDRLFIDPRALRLLGSEWGHKCVCLVQSFFQTVLAAIQDGDLDLARRLLGRLKEPNETHLGLSKARARGRGMGHSSAVQVSESLSKSMAVKSGLLTDLEDTILMVDGIGDDIISDMTTNIIRGPLIEYTQYVCHQMGIPLKPGVSSGPLWDPIRKDWTQSFVDLPMPDRDKLLLVPKLIVRSRMEYDADEYFRHHILPYLQKRELDAGSGLVELLKNGSMRVTKKSLVDMFGKSKAVAAEITKESPEILDGYRDAKKKNPFVPLSHERLADIADQEAPDWDKLLRAVTECQPGREEASQYHVAVMGLLNALLYPDLAHPMFEYQIHEGRKRIDITYCNEGRDGFFRWLARHYPSAIVPVECKNFTGDPANPELDQLSGRFSLGRGQFGILVCRNFEDRERFLARCKDTASDQRGYIIALDDGDLETLVDFRADGELEQVNKFLRKRFLKLIT